MEKKVKDYEGLYRLESGAIVNKDYDAYKSSQEERRRLISQEIKIKNIQNDLDQIKQMLSSLLCNDKSK